MNIVEPVLFQCRQNPPAAALCAPGTALNIISYARLERFIHNIGARALATGVRPGHTVAIQVKDSIFHTAIVLALARLGVVTLSIGELNLPAGLRIDSVITDAATVFGKWTGAPTILADLSWTEGDGRPVDQSLVSPGGNAVGRIVLTSGSSGAPKAVAITHDMEMRRIASLLYSFGNVSDCSRIFSDMTLGQGTCFRLLLYVLARGGTFFFPGPSPMDSLQTFDLYKVQGLFASPGGLGSILNFYETNTAFRSSFELIMTAGSLLSKSLSERVRARLARDIVIFYGSTETGTIATTLAHTVADIPGGVGYVTPGATLEIVDGEQRPLPRGAQGSVRVRGPMVVEGYFGDAQAQASFRDGFFYPGDLGQLRPDGMLVLSGREKEILNLGGAKIQPSMVEDVLAAHANVGEAAVIAVPNALAVDELWALIVPVAPLDEEKLRAWCRERLSVVFCPVRFLTVERLPRNPNGKLDRTRLKELATGKTQ